MNTQPEALRLADALDKTADFQMRAIEAAAELRRLHEVNQMLVAVLERWYFDPATVPWDKNLQDDTDAALAKAKEQA